MGHAIYYMDFPKETSKEAMFRARAGRIEAEGDRDPADGYLLASDNGFKLHPEMILDSYDEAIERINGLDCGWYDDHGVLYRSYSNVKPSKAYEQASEALEKTIAARKDYVEKNDIHNRKSSSVTCPECGSRLTLSYLRGNGCPLCKTDLRSETVQNRIKSFDKKISDLNKKCSELEKKQAGKAELRWLVKLEFHV